MKAPRYTYVVKGRHWYFRRYGRLEPLPGRPGEPDFTAAYNALLERSGKWPFFAERLTAERAVARAKRAAAARQRELATANTVKRGTVYFIGCSSSGPVKIGFTTNLAARLRRLQMNSPLRLRVLAAFDGYPRDELEVHQRFREHRLHGEWFKRTPEMRAEIRVCGTRETRIA